jgi:hypothetical protein
LTLNVDDVVARLHFDLRATLTADLAMLSPYAEAKARAVAHYAALIADAYVAGRIGEDDMARELDEIAEMTRRFTRGLRGLAGATAERVARSALRTVSANLRAALSLSGSPLTPALASRLG